MTWTLDIGDTTYTLQDGWFEDKIRLDGDFTYYLFSADGVTTEAPGLPGVTIASNLPELLSDNGLTYDSQERVSDFGDNTTISLESDYALIEGLPPHPVTGKDALDQKLLSGVEGIYWEGSRLDDNLKISINSASPTIQAIRYLGFEGDDTLFIEGDFEALVSQAPITDFGGSSFFGGEGEDAVRLQGNSSEWIIEQLEDEVGFTISKSDAGSFMARSVEKIITDDKIFNYQDEPDIITGILSLPARVKLSANGLTPFTLYGDSKIDVDQIDLNSLRFGITKENSVGAMTGGGDNSYQIKSTDVDGDGFEDLVAKVSTSELSAITPTGTSEISAFGKTLAGKEIVFELPGSENALFF
jgi:hypothetical protein